MPPFHQLPDAPQPFGYKVFWFAVKTHSPDVVVDALELGEATPANWSSGLAAVYADGEAGDPWAFVSPPVNGWVLAVSRGWPHPVAIDAHEDIGQQFDVLFSRLMQRFDDVQFFGSHRVVGLASWARATHGQPLRIFAYADGQVLANFGEQTPEEAELGFANLTGLSPTDAEDEIFRIAEEQNAEEEALIESGLSPREASDRVSQTSHNPMPDEEDVVKLAALWSVDPTTLDKQDHMPGTGLAVRLPEAWQQ